MITKALWIITFQCVPMSRMKKKEKLQSKWWFYCNYYSIMGSPLTIHPFPSAYPGPGHGCSSLSSYSLYPESCSFSHNPKLIGESRKSSDVCNKVSVRKYSTTP